MKVRKKQALILGSAFIELFLRTIFLVILQSLLCSLLLKFIEMHYRPLETALKRNLTLASRVELKLTIWLLICQ